ncbi:hypothetical protein SMU94_02710 [Streptococcus mutans 66-2A]|nr:putative holin-like toxin [Streptococcus mutans]EMC24961.1 hypothetical protein SMU81_00315 [Streptococcus mutans SF14]EMC39888.1 hypothetical protein SMU94_02710 [Streptococcus mutans 66-2A]MCB5109149.1 putative holin-like toxin [Streptococcus mutans]
MSANDMIVAIAFASLMINLISLIVVIIKALNDKK